MAPAMGLSWLLLACQHSLPQSFCSYSYFITCACIPGYLHGSPLQLRTQMSPSQPLPCYIPSHTHTHTHTHSFFPLFPSLFTSPILTMNFPGGSDCKASAYNAGDTGSIRGLGRSPGEGNAPHSSTLAWKIPWIEKPGGLQAMGSKESDTPERLHFTILTTMSFILFVYCLPPLTAKCTP